MRKLFLIVFLIGVCSLNAQKTLKPDLPPVKVATNTYHDVTLEDPYEYMEELSPEVITWMKDNANYASSVLNQISGKKALFDKMMELINRRAASISSLRITKNDIYYYIKRLPGEDIGKMYKRMGYQGEETLFFDPESYKKGGEETYAIVSINPNLKGDKIAVSVSANGSENPETLIFKENGERFPEVLQLAWVSSWLESGNEFYYTKLNSFDVTDKDRMLFTNVYIHKLGTEQTMDSQFFSASLYPDLEIADREMPYVVYDEVSKLNFLILSTVDKSLKLYYSEPNTKKAAWKVLTEQSDHVINIASDEKNLYYLTFKGAPNYKIVKASLENPSFANAETIVGESNNEIITDLKVTKDGLYYAVMRNGVEASVYFLANDAQTPMKLELPFTAGDAYMSNKNSQSPDIWISISGWTSPSKRYKYDTKTNTFVYQPLSTRTEYPELEDLIAKEVMVKSHDGVMVPVSIIHNKNLKLDGQNPAVIYGYGSYGISMTPFFSPITLAYTLYNGVLVVPHVRGGGELGDTWHKAGQKQTKPNTWKDAIATGEYLIKQGYTNANKLSMCGGSAGGIFVGRSITERPDLFVAGAPMVGLMNPIKAEGQPSGPANIPEFGTVKDSNDFKALLEMDSYHHIKDNTKYPAMLITSGINDPRVTAWEPAKFAAKMQAANISDKPILFLTNFKGGHGGGTKLSDTIDEFAGLFSFFYWQSGHPDFQLMEPIHKD